MATSNTYSFGTNTKVDDLIRDSFERIGLVGDVVTGLQINSAIMSANLELTSWQGRIPLSWTRKRFLISIYPNQPTYEIPRTVTQIVDVVATQPKRLNEAGVASASLPIAFGSPANCFNPLTDVGCTLGSPGGWIAYDYGQDASQSIQYVGITSLQSQSNYTLAVEYSFDNVNWTVAYQAPRQTYYADQIIWLVIERTVKARSWRIRETKSAVLEIKQIYFSVSPNTGPGDRLLTPLSYSDWMSLPQKNTTSTLSSYFFNPQIDPYLTLWAVLGPSSDINQFTGLLFTAYQYSQDVSSLFDQFDIPQRFYDALVAGISYRLAVKFSPDKATFLKSEAQEAFQLATLTEASDVTLSISPNFSNYYS